MDNPKFRLERVSGPVSNEEIISDIQRVAKLAGGWRTLGIWFFKGAGLEIPTSSASGLPC